MRKTVLHCFYNIAQKIDITVYQHGKCFIFLKYQHQKCFYRVLGHSVRSLLFTCKNFEMIFLPVKNSKFRKPRKNMLNFNMNCNIYKKGIESPIEYQTIARKCKIHFS